MMSYESQIAQLNTYAQAIGGAYLTFFAFVVAANVACVAYAFEHYRRSCLLVVLILALNFMCADFHDDNAWRQFDVLKWQHDDLVNEMTANAANNPVASAPSKLFFSFPFDEWKRVVRLITYVYYALAAGWLVDLLWRVITGICRMRKYFYDRNWPKQGPGDGHYVIKLARAIKQYFWPPDDAKSAYDKALEALDKTIKALTVAKQTVVESEETLKTRIVERLEPEIPAIVAAEVAKAMAGTPPAEA